MMCERVSLTCVTFPGSCWGTDMHGKAQNGHVNKPVTWLRFPTMFFFWLHSKKFNNQFIITISVYSLIHFQWCYIKHEKGWESKHTVWDNELNSWETSLCCPRAADVGAGNLRDAQKRAGHVVSLAGPWGAMGIAECWETQERLQNCRPMSGNIGLWICNNNCDNQVCPGYPQHFSNDLGTSHNDWFFIVKRGWDKVMLAQPK